MNDGFYAQLLDNASDLIWTTDVEGRITYINRRIANWGYDPSALIGKPMLDILNVRQMGNRMGETAGPGGLRKFEMVLEDKQGKPRHVVVGTTSLYNDQKEITGVLGIIQDVTETYNLMEKLKHEERLASLGRLATGIAHEIRNPLSSIKMNLAILGKRLTLNAQDNEHFEIAKEGVANLEKIVTEFISYAKPMPLKTGRQNLHQVIDEIIAMLKPQCEEANVTIERKYAKSMPLVSIDKMKIQQALLNVILNALQASAKGDSITLHTAHVDVSPAYVVVEVEDRGVGISEEDVQFVFDPFFTTKRSGTGLGLSIVRSILVTHNGSVDIKSKKGKGTKITFKIPVSGKSV